MMDNRIQRITTRIATVTACVVVSWFSGCQSLTSPDAGTTGGRMDPYRTTEADRGSHKANMPALLEYSDRVAEALVRQLADIEQIKNAPRPSVLELGNLRNLSRTPTQDFELIQHRIRGHLLASDFVPPRFKIVENASRMDRELRRVDAHGSDQTARYDADDIYLLTGDFFESARDNSRRYYFEFKLVHLASRSILMLEQFDWAQR